ncbi:MAG: gliding motility-associated C-terminal domain-containing protein [Bacteroidales bacterium]|nr:gliding motility-associated C-terminal domain-containing protein [Bacteroidales bacterium]
MNIIRKVTRYILLAACFLTCGTRVMAQQYTQYLIENDTLFISPCLSGEASGTIEAYDGFPYRGYTGWVVIETTVGDTLTLNGTYGIWDGWLTVWDGTPNGGTELLNANWVGEQLLNLVATSGRFTIYFHTDSGDDERFSLTWQSLNPSLCCAERLSNLTSSITPASNGSYNASLSWQTTAPAGVQYRVAINDIPIDTMTTTTYTVTGLEGGKQYHVAVGIIGNEGCGYSTTRTILRTPCTTQINLPLQETFDDIAVDSIPPCWLMSKNYDDPESSPRITGNYFHSATRSMLMGCGSNDVAGHFSIVATPPVNQSGTWMITLRVRASHNNTRLLVGIADTAMQSLALSGFTSLATVEVQNNMMWESHTVRIPVAVAGKRLALVMQQGMQDGTGRRVYIDDMRAESCGADSLLAYHIDSDSLMLRWTTLGNPVCSLGIRRAGSMADDTVLTGVTSPLTVRGLNPSTRYTFTVYPVCGSQHGFPISVIASTSEDLNAAASFCSGFSEVMGQPNNWTVHPFRECNNTTYGDHHFYMYTGCCCQEGGWLISPTMGSLAGKTVNLNLNYVNTGTMILLGVLQYAGDTSSFIIVDTFYSTRPDGDANGGTWCRKFYSFTIPNNVDGRNLAMHYVNYGWYTECEVWGVSVGDHQLSGLHAAHVRGTKVELRWDTTFTDNVVIEYGPRNFHLGSGIRDTLVAHGRCTISGLTPSTEYDFVAWYVGEEPCSDFRIRTTTSRDDYPLPYCVDFYEWDNCIWESWCGDWRNLNGLYNTPRITDQPWYYAAGRTLELGSYGFRDSYYTTAAIPDVEIDSDAVVSFYAASSTPLSYLVMGMWNEYSDNTFHAFDTITLGGDRQHYVYHLPDSIADAEGRLCMRWWHPNQYSFHHLYIDELHISHITYTSLAPSHVGFDTASFACTDSVQLTLIGGGDTMTLVTPNLHTGGLDTGTLYLMYVRPLADTNSCLSYAGYFITSSYGGYAGCYTFDDLLSYELPYGWYFSDSARVDDGILVFDSMAVMPPLGDISGQRLTLRRPNADTLLVGYTIDSIAYTIVDTVTTATATFYLPSVPDSAQLVLFSADTARIDMIGLSGCRIVRFNTTGGKIICSVQGGGADYLLTATDTATSNVQTFHITETPFIINSLLLDHTYHLGYQCIGDYTACSPDTIITISDSIMLPYCISFEIGSGGTGVPANWTFVYDNDIVPALELGWGETPLRLGEWWRPNQYTILPSIAGSNDVSVKFRVHSWDIETFQIGTVNANADTSTFIPLYTNNNETGWIEKDIPIHSLGNRRIAFRTHSLNLLHYLNVSNNPKVTVSLIGFRTLKLTADTEDSIVDYYMRYSNDSVVHVTTNPYVFVENNADDIAFTLAQDSTGYICGYENWWGIGGWDNLPLCPQNEYWDGWYRTYGDAWDDYYRGRRPHNMRLNYDHNNYAYRIFRDFNIDSVRHLTLRFDLNSDRVGEMIEVGVMTDAYDTGSFTPVDSFYYTAEYNRWQTCHVSFANYTGDGRWIAFRHRSGQCSDCNGQLATGNYWVTNGPASTATATLNRWNTVLIDAAAPGFYMEYDTAGFWQGTGTIVRVDTVPMLLTLSGQSTYDFYFRYDSIDNFCDNPQHVHTGIEPINIPQCIDFNTTPIAALRGWTLHDDGTEATDSTMHITGLVTSPDINIDSLQGVAVSLWFKATNSNDRLRVGTMTDPADPQTFWTAAILAAQTIGVWQHFIVDLSASPSNAHFLALKGTGYVDNIRLDTSAANSFTVLHVESNTITLGWSSVGHPDITITIRQGDNIVNTYTNPVPPLTISGLTTLAPYTFLFQSSTGDTGICSMAFADSVKLITPAEGIGCVNTTDLFSPQAVFTTGTYGNPYAKAGAVDYGYSHPDSRHTICYDTSARDPRTGGLLRMVPDDHTSSVRLGNPSTNLDTPEAEAVTYSLFVDTMSFDLLVMRYAAVLQDPMHDLADQPRFRVEILDSAMNPIDPVCASADFIADASLGWNTAADNVLWKDWTTFGIDLTSYAGQQVFVRLTTYDCNEGSHYGYAYFTLDCMRKNVSSLNCGATDSNTFTAPAGFNYRWYRADTPSATVATTQSITVSAAEERFYHCDVSFADNASCMFTMSVFAGTRFPMASFDTTMTMAGCHFAVDFTNTSGVSADGVNLIPGEGCESAYWDFGNGQTSTSYHASTVYTSPGTYTVMLVSGIAGGSCKDTLLWSLAIDFPTNESITGPTSLCYGDVDTLRLHNAMPYTASEWTPDGDEWVLPLTTGNYSLGTNSYTLLTIDPYGCLQTTAHTVTVNPVYPHLDTMRICTSMLPWSYADTTFGPGTTSTEYHLNVQSIDGCDSSYHLVLNVSDIGAGTIRDTVAASICDNQSYSFFGSEYTDQGTHTDVHVDANGFCDSIHTLLLEVRHTSHTDTVADECDRFTWYGVTSTVDTTLHRLLQNAKLCDSTVTLDLTLRHSTDTAVHHYIVENELPYLWNGLTFTTDTIDCTYNTLNAAGCDSTILFALTIYRNSDTLTDSTICEGRLPLVWNGVTFNTANPAANRLLVDSAMLTTWHGADSLVVMRLHLLLNSSDTTADTIVQNQLPWSWNGIVFDTAGIPPIDAQRSTIDTLTVIPNAVGCDSSISYSLTVYWNRLTELDSTICDDALPLVWEGLTFTQAATLDTTLATTNGADSTLVLNLAVNPTFEVSDTHIICPSQGYIYEGVDYGGPTAFDSPHLSILGCDSLVHVVLQPRDTTYRLTPLYHTAHNANGWEPLDTMILGCMPDTLYLRDTTHGALGWQWTITTPNDTAVYTSDNAIHTFGDTTYSASLQLVITSDVGCIDTLTQPIYIFRTPQAEFDWNPVVPAIDNPEVTFHNTSWPADSLTWLWNIPPQTGSTEYDTSTLFEPTYHWGQDGDNMEGDYDVQLIAYWTQLHLTQPLGDTIVHTCTDTATHTVTITNDFLQFPNLVTPNGDGKNDVWLVVNLLEYGNYPINELWIFNQWGVEVYHVRNIHEEKDFWNPNATSSPDGTYYYRFTARGPYGLVKRNGIIEVLRK